jgi:cell division protein ZipA
MDSFRISLIVIGVLFLAGLYLWMRFIQNRRQDVQQRVEPSFDSSYERHEDNTRFSDVMDEELAAVVTEQEIADQPAEPEQEPSQPETKSAPPAIVSLHILANAQQVFEGPLVIQSASQAGMEFGQMNIFHCQAGEDSPIFFSMANMLEPGVFNMDEIDSFTTPGLLLFMDLSQQGNVAEAIEAMLETGLKISKGLGGRLCDERRQPLAEGGAEQWKFRALAQVA